MADEYATLAQLKARLMNKVAAGDDTELNGILEASSRAVDDYLELYPGYFTPPTGASTKSLKGSGNTFITLPAPLYGSVTITADGGITVPNFTVEGMRLRTLDDNDRPADWIVWRAGYYYLVNGNWGYAATPAQIREAVLQLSVHFWRGRDKALTGTITDMRTDEQFPERDFPRMTRRILDDFKFNLGEKPSGGFTLA